MRYTIDAALDRLLESYRRYYNILPVEDGKSGLVAVCEFYERSEKFVLSRKAELWSANCEEFLYLYRADCLTEALLETILAFVREDGLSRAHIGPGHMYTYLTPVILCNTCTDGARKALRRCRFYRSFRLGLHGWVDLHAAALEVATNTISTNKSGRCVEKVLKTVLFSQKEKRRWKSK